jgi:HD-GYP domain-containing protein (c-di-GMP phosphodiesterase class II)
MMEHVKETEEIILPINNFDVINLASSHHETMDGKGYHRRLKEFSLDEDQSILNTADIMGALLAKREYKPALPFDRAMKILIEEVEKNQKAKPYIIDAYGKNEEQVMKAFNRSKEDYERIENIVINMREERV